MCVSSLRSCVGRLLLLLVSQVMCIQPMTATNCFLMEHQPFLMRSEHSKGPPTRGCNPLMRATVSTLNIGTLLKCRAFEFC